MTALAMAARWRATIPRMAFLPTLEACLSIVMILLFTSALLPQIFDGATSDDGASVLRLVWPPVYLLTLILIVSRPMPVLFLAVRAWPVMALAGLTLASMLWSISPDISFRRGLGVLMTALFGLWLASRYGWVDLIRLVAAAYAILAVGSFLMAVMFPQYGVMHEIHVGAWSGLWFEKNRLGAVMSLGAAAFMAAALTTPHRREVWFWSACVLLAVFLVVMSTSRTSLMATMIAVAGPVMIYLARQGVIMGLVAVASGVAGVMAIGLVVLIGPGVILEALGRDPTLTGRTDIWRELFVAIGNSPWLGHGYGAFWETENGPVFWVRQSTQWDVPTAHNAWLEIALDLGLLGLGLLALSFVWSCIRALRLLFSGPEAYWALPALAIWGLTSMSESILVLQNNSTWLLLSMTMCKLAQPGGLYRNRP